MTTPLDHVPAFAFRALNAVLRPLVKRGAGSPLPIGVGTVVLETTGRRSGLTRQVPLAATRVGDTVVVSTVRQGSQWLRNLEADPSARVWVGGRAREATATIERIPGMSLAVLRIA